MGGCDPEATHGLDNSLKIMLPADMLTRYIDAPKKDRYQVYDICSINDRVLYSSLGLTMLPRLLALRFSNVAIAAAITAQSRIIMDAYKRIPGNPCYYTDTDSVILRNPLPEYLSKA
jgi:hypothetical protein